MHIISERVLTHYDICEISRKGGSNNSPVSNIGLNELLFVADKEQLIETNSYHLGYYIRNFRNVVHLTKEIRMKEDITHGNVLIMWSVLFRIITELLKQTQN